MWPWWQSRAWPIDWAQYAYDFYNLSNLESKHGAEWCTKHLEAVKELCGKKLEKVANAFGDEFLSSCKGDSP